ncbi:DNA repair protein RecO [Candidatus Kinetoplastibacterium blastocrithidii TCC012E]|uniref:DNA repair protein RecO n=1 Tax=Candidatus Kinetoplastidibacterium blastocrithidiae TCC012E TaxID=1208922 RepID=M1M0S7_9PROT|nr:DNA repair protein RecO [Candidatus Kinetoplastibacterium blastocrithidii]AFZ83758.1 DNA repair protein RecO [Candidatus Kinetoplastibacterium blastocrithidii (ex Strigomonas culicis)]AGF49881.1 DNA repair protein RecO [Candidatus Kinetoplastibacterium blastocrithidii TCC012E]
MSRFKSSFVEDDCYVLHSIPWKETSSIIKIFSRNHGCISIVAKGAKRPYSQLRPVLLSFQHLLLAWKNNTSNIKTLVRADLGEIFLLPGDSLMSAWYMNELILYSLASEDSHPSLFDEYSNSLKYLCNKSNYKASILRRFEWFLLKEIGYGIDKSEPDFNNQGLEPVLRLDLRRRMETMLGGKELLTKKILFNLHYSTTSN